ncbi:hypothetical protein HA402_010613 [Bradysia odoriphaga]|nr:hypothetical protein HA402_010613 [Bradysia odoriphaga]
MFSTTYNKTEKLWYGPEIQPLYNPKISLAQALLEAMTNYGPKIAQISDNNGIQMSFDEIKLKTIRAAQNLQVRGYKPKQVFGLVAKNSQNVAPIFFASIAVGCSLNTLDTSFGRTELIHMLNITKPVLLFCDVECVDLLEECLKELGINSKIFTFGDSTGDYEPIESLFKETHKETQFIPVKVDGENDTAMIVCSSGTFTGFSKGVCLSHAALLDGTTQYKVTNSSDVMLSFSSLYWITGIGTLLTGTLCGATRIITTDSFTPEFQLKLIEQYKVTYIFNAVHQVALMMRSDRFKQTDLSSLKYLITGGSKVPLNLKRAMNEFLPNGNVHVVYGMTEISNAVSLDYPTSNRDTVGRIIGGCCVKIVDDHGNRCGENEDGEVCITMNHTFLGYLNDAQATKAIFDSEDFFRTGDIGHFDEDGYLYLVDRKTDLIRNCGYKIPPSELDAYLMESPEIKSACVFGIPNEVVTHLPAALIIRADGSNISEQDIFDMIADRFSDYCKLRGGVYFVDSFPRTASGKVKRGEVRKIAIKLYNDSKS